jgi:hypothetical protein
VETFSGQGGTIFRGRWKLFQGRVEGFSHQGGSKFRVRWKENRGAKWIGGTIFRAKIRDPFRVGRKNPVLYME